MLALAREHQQVVPLLAKADLDAATAGKLREYAHACLHGVAVAVETAAWEMDTIPMLGRLPMRERRVSKVATRA